MTDLNYQPHFSKKFYQQAMIALLFIFISRLIVMYLTPLIDVTEARYSEIVREMFRSHNWVTLTHDYGVPFLAKPPLSTWLSVCSMKLLGVNELAVRLPSLLLSMVTLWLIGDLAKKRGGPVLATLSVLFLCGGFYFYLNAGVMMTDASLVFCITLAMTSFWHSIISPKKYWPYLFFIALGLGLLAKGPVATVLTMMPILLWVLIRKKWKAVWYNLPWINGSLIALAIALPWYIMAELRTPGFFNYFLVGEHFNRFFMSGWHGNKYGHSHAEPYGMIWLYGIVGLFPWSLVAGYWLIYHGKKLVSFFRQDDQGWLLYLLIWAYLPLLFFSFASNIIYTYVFPSLPAFALLFAELGKRSGLNEQQARQITYIALLTSCCFLLATLLLLLGPSQWAKSQKTMIATWLAQKPPLNSTLIYWTGHLEYSAQFYTDGKALATKLPYQLRHLLASNQNTYLVIKEAERFQIPADLSTQFIEIKKIQVAKTNYVLLRQVVNGLCLTNSSSALTLS